jgi:hypothetical protein
MNPIVITSANLDDTESSNSRYRYTFPVGIANFNEKFEVALGKISIYYSWFNITKKYGNNVFQYRWINNTTYTVTIEDGYYDVEQINARFQKEMIQNNHYLINTDGEYVYYLEITSSSTLYAIVLLTYAVPSSLPSGWTAPDGFSFTNRTPQFIINANAFRDVIGFNTGTYPPTHLTVDYSIKSQYTPQVSPTQSILLSVSFIKNPYFNPNTILYSFTAANTEFGSIIEVDPNNLSFVPIQQGSYSEIFVQFYDQGFQPLQINDTNLTIILYIRENQKIE